MLQTSYTRAYTHRHTYDTFVHHRFLHFGFASSVLCHHGVCGDMLPDRESSSARHWQRRTQGTEHRCGKDWLFHWDWLHPGGREANAPNPKRPVQASGWVFKRLGETAMWKRGASVSRGAWEPGSSTLYGKGVGTRSSARRASLRKGFRSSASGYGPVLGFRVCLGHGEGLRLWFRGSRRSQSPPLRMLRPPDSWFWSVVSERDSASRRLG